MTGTIARIGKQHSFSPVGKKTCAKDGRVCILVEDDGEEISLAWNQRRLEPSELLDRERGTIHCRRRSEERVHGLGVAQPHHDRHCR